MTKKERVIIYGLGYYWKEKFDEIKSAKINLESISSSLLSM